ncbi:MAG: hypothetical protein ACYSTR_06155, partial [Planctomycetota bacterium]
METSKCHFRLTSSKSLFCGFILSALTVFLWQGYLHCSAEQNTALKSGYLGSSQCRPCHEKFYQLWAPSHHGLAMQPYSESFA